MKHTHHEILSCLHPAEYDAKTPPRLRVRRAVARALRWQSNYLRKGRSFNRAGFHTTTPLEILPDASAPALHGAPYLKTTFRKRNFTRTLYTPSTLRATVGRDWLRARGLPDTV